MNQDQKIQLVENMRRYGGNFVSKLADAMIAADPQNFQRICDAFPEIVKRFERPWIAVNG
jgi:hypothetical protein